MPGLPCAKHPNEITYVRCGRCEKPICVRCMVDTPVGKRCRECAQNRTHLSESTPRQVGLAFIAALAVALPAGWLMHQIPIFPLMAFPYGFVVAEAALRAGQRSRSLPVQVVTGIAALIGGVLGGGLDRAFGPAGPLAFSPFSLILIGLGVAVAVSRVRFL
jgi:hypothetical protein